MATDQNGPVPSRGGDKDQGRRSPTGGGETRRQLPAIRPPSASQTPSSAAADDLARLGGVEVDVTLLLGRTEITLEEAAQLDEKSLLAVDKRADEPVEVLINGELYAHGKLVMVGDHYGVQLLELVGQHG